MQRKAAMMVSVGMMTCVACGSSTTSSGVGGTPNGNSADSQAAQQSAQSADDASSSDSATASHSPTSGFALANRAAGLFDTLGGLDGGAAINTTLDAGGCTAQVVGTTALQDGNFTLDANVSFSSASCTGGLKLSGTEEINATWGAGGRVVEVTSDLVRTLADSDTITSSTLDASVGWTYQVQATGTAQSGTTMQQVAINEHRVRAAGNSNVIFDHNITTDPGASLQVSTTFAASGNPNTRTVQSGTIRLHHNLAHFLAVHAFTDVKHDLSGSCLCPSSGTIVQTVTKDDNSGSYVRTYAFTGCGAGTVTTSASTLKGTENGSANVTWSDCGS